MILRDVPGFEGRYAASDDGRVWSYPKTWICNGSKRGHGGRWLNPTTKSTGYHVVNIDGRLEFVHRLIARAWELPRYKQGKREIINHLNGIKTDNRPANLEWCDDARNHKHAHAIGLRTVSVRQRAVLMAGRRKGILHLQTPEVRAKAAAANRGQKRSDSFKQQLRDRVVSDETSRRISIAATLREQRRRETHI